MFTRTVLVLVCVVGTATAFVSPTSRNAAPATMLHRSERPFATRRVAYSSKSSSTSLRTSSPNFYNDFGDFEDEDEGEDDEDEDNEDDEFGEMDVASFRSRMENIMGTGDDTEEEEEEEDFIEFPTISDDDFVAVDELISAATSTASSESDAATPVDRAVPLYDGDKDGGKKIGDLLDAGVVLLANPARFCSDFPDVDDESGEGDSGGSTNSNGGGGGGPIPSFFGGGGGGSGDVSSALLAKFGLTLPPPTELGPDRRADLLPVLLLTERHALRGSQALLLNRRTGYLIGDLDQQQQQQQQQQGGADATEEPEPTRLWAFMIQPLWFGGTSPGDAGGLDMLHPCDNDLPDSVTLPACEGLYWGGDPAEAQRVVDADQSSSSSSDDDVVQRRPPLSGFDFKFFVQSTRWLPTQLEKEIRDGTWFVASVNKEVLFRSRDRLGAKRAKPLWTEIMELMGGKYRRVRDRLYEDE